MPNPDRKRVLAKAREISPCDYVDAETDTLECYKAPESFPCKACERVERIATALQHERDEAEHRCIGIECGLCYEGDEPIPSSVSDELVHNRGVLRRICGASKLRYELRRRRAEGEEPTDAES